MSVLLADFDLKKQDTQNTVSSQNASKFVPSHELQSCDDSMIIIIEYEECQAETT